MSKSKSKPADHDHEPENESHEVHEARGTRPVPTKPDGSPNKAAMVAAAYEAGHKTPKEGVQWIEGNFGYEMSRIDYSAAKTPYETRLRKQGLLVDTTTKPERSPHRQTTSTGTTTTATMPEGFAEDLALMRAWLRDHDNNAEELCDQIAEVDSLVRKYGVSELNKILKTLAE